MPDLPAQASPSSHPVRSCAEQIFGDIAVKLNQCSSSPAEWLGQRTRRPQTSVVKMASTKTMARTTVVIWAVPPLLPSASRFIIGPSMMGGMPQWTSNRANSRVWVARMVRRTRHPDRGRRPLSDDGDSMAAGDTANCPLHRVQLIVIANGEVDFPTG